jgi:hypothetical protein
LSKRKSLLFPLSYYMIKMIKKKEVKLCPSFL